MSTLQQHIGAVPDVRTLHTAIGSGSKGDWLFLDSNTDKVVGVSEFESPNWFSEYQDTPMYSACCKLDSNRVMVFFYVTNIADYFLFARVLNISGDKVSAGQAYVIELTRALSLDCCLIDTNKVAFVYRDQGDSDIGKAIILTASGDIISHGDPVAFTAKTTARYGHDIDVCKLDTNKFLVSYSDRTTPYHGFVVAGTVSGTVPTFGSEVDVNSGAAAEVLRCCPLGTDKALTVFRDPGTSGYPSAVALTVSGTTITLGTKQTWDSVYGTYFGPVQISTDKFFIAWGKNYAANGYGIVGTASGTVLSFGTEQQWYSGAIGNEQLTSFLIDTDKVAIVGEGPTNDHNITVGTISGTVMTFGSGASFLYESDTTVTHVWGCPCGASNKVLTVWTEGSGNTGRGTTRIGSVSGTTVSLADYRYTGIAAQDYTDAGTVEVMHSGVLSGISKPGMDRYYLPSTTMDLVVPRILQRLDLNAIYLGYDSMPGTRVLFSRGRISEE